MRRHLVVCLLIACERTQAPAPAPVTPPPVPQPIDAASAPDVGSSPDAAAPLDATYSSEAIREAETAIQRACGMLVYKDECRVLRRGTIKLAVTLDTTGVQTKVDIVENTATPDGPKVLACVKKALAAHAFVPPATSTTLTIAFQLADKC